MSQTTTSEIIFSKYPPLITVDQVAEIFGNHVQTVRVAIKRGTLPLQNVAYTEREKRYRLSDVIDLIENPRPKKSQLVKRGRPVGSKNKINSPQ